jgi:hypothetical protein
VLRGWHTAAAAAAQEREQQARLQETFSKVQGWLSDMKGGGGAVSADVSSAVAVSRGCASAQGAAAPSAVAAAGRQAVLRQLPPWRDWNPDSDTDAD